MSRRTVIHTLRHAQTDYSVERRYAGSLDIGLNAQGVREAEAASRRLKAMRYDVIVTSPLRRACDTARIVARGSVPVVCSALCVERCFGVLEGRTWSDVRRMVPPVLTIRVGGQLHTVNPKGGEPFESVWNRAGRFCRWLLNRYPDRRILVVSHGVFLQLLHGVIRGANCIESLAAYPQSMQLTRFVLTGTQLAHEETEDLRGAGANRPHDW